MRRVVRRNLYAAAVFLGLWVFIGLICVITQAEHDVLDGLGLVLLPAAVLALFLVNAALTWTRYGDEEWMISDIFLRLVLTVLTPLLPLVIMAGLAYAANLVLPLFDR